MVSLASLGLRYLFNIGKQSQGTTVSFRIFLAMEMIRMILDKNIFLNFNFQSKVDNRANDEVFRHKIFCDTFSCHLDSGLVE